MSRFPPDPRPRTRRRWLPWITLALACLVLSLLWSFTPARELIDPGRLIAGLQSLGQQATAPWLVLAGFVLGGLLALPVTLMVVTAIVMLGPWIGFLCALGGATLSATIAFGLGHGLGHRALAQMAGSRLHDLSLRLRGAGVVVVAALRMVPVAHFTLTSLVAGATHIRLRDFVLGTLLGMAPGIAVIAVFIDRLLAANARPGPEQYLWLALVSLALLAVLLGMRWFARRLVRARERRRGRARGQA